jgi:3-dehydroquinate synthase
VGGGAVLDMLGYVAATAHRGVRLVRAPSTVLSQNDSVVGVKNGINATERRISSGRSRPLTRY